MKFQALMVCAWLLIGQARADDIGRVCDRNGILLITVCPAVDGGVALSYPLRALGAQLLSDLDPAVLPRKGETLYLTIDARMQVVAENNLRKVPRGCAVVLDSKNGDILALASVPSFDPNSRDFDRLCIGVGLAISQFTPSDCRNYFRHANYATI